MLGVITYVIDFMFPSPLLGQLQPYTPCPSHRLPSHTLVPHYPPVHAGHLGHPCNPTRQAPPGGGVR